jgi:thiosulfate dehydrogenase (quinone) large subunit
MSRQITYEPSQITDPPMARLLFSDTRLAWIWLIIRFYMAYEWITSGWAKLNNPAWTVTGSSLKGFWTSALATTPKPVISFDWYRAFIQFLVDTQSWTWFSKLVVAGELLVGIALLLGAFTGIAAFFGGLMNWNFMMAGSASVNPVFFLLSVFVIMAWKVAGYYGLDRVLLAMVGTPWRPGYVIKPQRQPQGTVVAE